jgi:hypothetical protein
MDWQKYPKSRTSIKTRQPETLDSIKCHTFPGMGGRTLEDILLHDFKKIVPKDLIGPAHLNSSSVETAETALRQHRGALLANPARKNGQSTCAADQRMPLLSGWSGQGQRAAGTALRLDWRVRLQLESDSDSLRDRDGEGGAQSPVRGGRGGSPSPPPVDLPAVLVPPADVLVPAADGGVPQVHTCIYIIYMVHGNARTLHIP